MNDRLLPPHRRPVVIADTRLRAGGRSARATTDDPEALLRQYLRLIRRVRNQQRHRTVALRRADIVALADHLGLTDDEVLARLADLMGVTKRQRATMLAVLATGASLVTIGGPAVAAAGATPGAAVDSTPVVVLADHLASGRPLRAEHVGRLAPPDESAPRPTASGQARIDRHAPVLEAQHRRGDAPARARIDRPAPQGDAPQPSTLASPGAVPQAEPLHATEPEPAPQVAVGEPPTAPATDGGGDFVAVGEPPVPPPPNVAVGEPPVPPPSDVAIDGAGNSVAVGEPPVPPAPLEPPAESPAELSTDAEPGDEPGDAPDDA